MLGSTPSNSGDTQLLAPSLNGHPPQLPAPQKAPVLRLKPKPICEFKAPPGAAGYIVERLVPRAMITQWNSRHKRGKTTLLHALLHVLGTGGTFCDLAVAQTNTLVLSEEPEGVWEQRPNVASLPKCIVGQSIPFDGKPTHQEWQKFVADEVLPYCLEHGIGLVVIDTLGGLSSVKEENASAEVPVYMAPLRLLNKQGIACLIFHHHGWSDARSRGTSGLPAYVDVIVDLFREPDGDRKTRRRRLIVEGRLHSHLSELVVELSDDGITFHAVEADPAVPQKPDTLSVLKGMNPPAEGWTPAAMALHWPHGDKPDVKTIQNNLKKAGWHRVDGTGKKGTPVRYTK